MGTVPQNLAPFIWLSVHMIDHPLNTSYDHNDLSVYTAMWQRPKDISELLTHLMQHSKCQEIEIKLQAERSPWPEKNIRVIPRKNR